MALPIVEEKEIEEAANEVKQEARELALSEVVGKATVEMALQEAQAVKKSDPRAFLESVGVTDVKTDFTSFPIITLNDDMFSSPEFKKFGNSFECIFLMKKKQFLFKGDLGRDKEPELVYSEDGLTDHDGEPIAKYIESWKERNIPWERKEYALIITQMIDSPHEGEICQIQVSPTSLGKLGGYYLSLGLKQIDPSTIVTRVGVGAQIGSGIKAFYPFTFKQVK